MILYPFSNDDVKRHNQRIVGFTFQAIWRFPNESKIVSAITTPIDNYCLETDVSESVVIVATEDGRIWRAPFPQISFQSVDSYLFISLSLLSSHSLNSFALNTSQSHSRIHCTHTYLFAFTHFSFWFIFLSFLSCVVLCCCVECKGRRNANNQKKKKRKIYAKNEKQKRVE
jgi:hypothetical protein